MARLTGLAYRSFSGEALSASDIVTVLATIPANLNVSLQWRRGKPFRAGFQANQLCQILHTPLVVYQ